MMYKRLLFIFIGLVLTGMTYAQEDWEENTGEIEDVEVQIIKDREITLLKANRNFEKLNPTFAPADLPKFEYKFQEFDFSIPDLTFRLRPLRIKNEQLSKLYGGYLKAGFGNFGTPYLEGYVNNKRDQQYSVGAHVKHLSSKNGPIDDENSGTSINEVDLFGKVFSKKVVLGGDLGYSMNQVHFYGYPDGTDIAADDIKQQINRLKVNGFIRSNNDSDDPGYQLVLGYQNVSDDFEAKEGIFSTDLTFDYPISKESGIELDANVQVISRSDANVSEDRLLFSAQPAYKFSYSGFRLQAGLNMTYENDTLQDLGKFHVYPVVKAAYDISDAVELYAGVDGGIVANTYASAVNRTPFMAADVQINHTNRLYQFSGGMKAKLSQNSYLHTGFSMGGYKYFQYLTNDPTDNAKFVFSYDPETSTVANLFGEWGLSKTQKLELSLRSDYFIYNMGSSDDVFHLPTYKVAVLAKYNLYDKIILESKLYMLGGIKAIDTGDSSVIELDPALDLSLKGTYMLSDQFSLFVKFDNILANEYQLLNRYPVRGLQVMGGLSYTF